MFRRRFRHLRTRSPTGLPRVGRYLRTYGTPAEKQPNASPRAVSLFIVAVVISQQPPESFFFLRRVVLALSLGALRVALALAGFARIAAASHPLVGLLLGHHQELGVLLPFNLNDRLSCVPDQPNAAGSLLLDPSPKSGRPRSLRGGHPSFLLRHLRPQSPLGEFARFFLLRSNHALQGVVFHRAFTRPVILPANATADGVPWALSGSVSLVATPVAHLRVFGQHLLLAGKLLLAAELFDVTGHATLGAYPRLRTVLGDVARKAASVAGALVG
mmetsp:Transcript_5405/g.24061  ORF Transcript_5405/g.24061 Transcript_5405/m.24061 type:complete len:273 (+) Transcript_5405:4156-4974(+)